MAYVLALDTCIWISLAISDEDALRRLRKWVDDGKITLIVPSQVSVEWKRHRDDKVVGQRKRSIRGKLKNATDALSLLGAEEGAEFAELVGRLNQDEARIEGYAEDSAQTVDFLLEHPNTIRTTRTPEHDSIVVSRALDGAAPFHNSKNNVADGMILFEFLDHVEKHRHQFQRYVFVSSNTSEYCRDKKVHPDLECLFAELGITFYSSIGEAMNVVEPGSVAEETVRDLDVIATLAMVDWEKLMPISNQYEELVRQGMVDWANILPGSNPLEELVRQGMVDWEKLMPISNQYEELVRQGMVDWANILPGSNPLEELVKRGMVDWEKLMPISNQYEELVRQGMVDWEKLMPISNQYEELVRQGMVDWANILPGSDQLAELAKRGMVDWANILPSSVQFQEFSNRTRVDWDKLMRFAEVLPDLETLSAEISHIYSILLADEEE